MGHDMKKLGLLFALALAISLVTHAEPHHTQKHNVMGSPLPPGVVSSVDPYYRGMNVSAIYDVLHASLGEFKPSEYESSTQFETRLAKVSAVPLVGGRKVGEQYTFVLGTAWVGGGSVSDKNESADAYLSGALRTSYDAEAQMLTVTIPVDTGVQDFDTSSGIDHNSFRLGYGTVSNRGHYVGQNAYGVKKVISDVLMRIHSLEVDSADISWLKTYCKQEGGLSDVECTMSVPREKARAMDGGVRAAFGATLKAPFTEERSDVIDATINSPYQIRQIYQGLFIHPNQLVIFNESSGEILAQYTEPKVDPIPEQFDARAEQSHPRLCGMEGVQGCGAVPSDCSPGAPVCH
jgi:hypothetical protein